MYGKTIEFLKEGLLEEALMNLSDQVNGVGGNASATFKLRQQIELLRTDYQESVEVEDLESRMVQQSQISIRLLEICRYYGEFKGDEVWSIVESQNNIIARQRVLISKLSSRLAKEGRNDAMKSYPRIIRPHIKSAVSEVTVSRINKSNDSENIFYVGCTVKEDPDKLIAFSFPRHEAVAVAVSRSEKIHYVNGYDLFLTYLSDMNYKIVRVVIDAYRGKKYYCKYVVDQDGVEIEFGSNHVEGITLASLLKVPLLVAQDVLETNAFSMKKFEENKE